MKTLGQVAYEGYCAATDGKSAITGAALPSWEGVNPGVKTAWEAAAYEVSEAIPVTRREAAIRILEHCLGYLRTDGTRQDYEAACRLLNQEPS